MIIRFVILRLSTDVPRTRRSGHSRLQKQFVLVPSSGLEAWPLQRLASNCLLRPRAVQANVWLRCSLRNVETTKATSSSCAKQLSSRDPQCSSRWSHFSCEIARPLQDPTSVNIRRSKSETLSPKRCQLRYASAWRYRISSDSRRDERPYRSTRLSPGWWTVTPTSDLKGTLFFVYHSFIFVLLKSCIQCWFFVFSLFVNMVVAICVIV